MVLGVGAGIGFGFGGATCRGGVVGLEVPGLFVLAVFWSFANRFSRIYPSRLNTLSRNLLWICLPYRHHLVGLGPAGLDLDRSSWWSSRLSVCDLGTRGDPRAPTHQTRQVALVTLSTAPAPFPNAPHLHPGDLPAECGGRFPFQLKVVHDLICTLVSQVEIAFRD